LGFLSAVTIHDKLKHGQAVPIDVPELARFAARIAAENLDDRRQFEILKSGNVATSQDHHDPIPGYWGRWLAGFARVGQTDQVVIVETRYDAVTLVEEYVWRVIRWAGGLVAVAFTAISAAALALRKRAWV
jgi:hypothetical protein